MILQWDQFPNFDDTKPNWRKTAINDRSVLLMPDSVSFALGWSSTERPDGVYRVFVDCDCTQDHVQLIVQLVGGNNEFLVGPQTLFNVLFDIQATVVGGMQMGLKVLSERLGSQRAILELAQEWAEDQMLSPADIIVYHMVNG